MVRHSNKSVAEILSRTNVLHINGKDSAKHLDLLERKITLVTEDFTTNRFCELVLRDRSKLSNENALTICDCVIAMKVEINLRLSYKRNIIQILAELSKAVGIQKRFIDMTCNMYQTRDISLKSVHAPSTTTPKRVAFYSSLNVCRPSSSGLLIYGV